MPTATAAVKSDLADRVDRVVDSALEQKKIVGTVVVVLRNGRVLYHRAAGSSDREAGREMKQDTIFRLASVSKPLTAAAAMALCERGQIGLDDPITRFLPDFRPKLADGTEPVIKVRHLLTHTAGFDYASKQPADGPYAQARISDGLDQPGVSLEENLRRLASVPLHFEPGTEWRYGMSLDVLGAVVARVHGTTLGDAIAQSVTGPIGMRDTGFRVTDPARLTVAYADGETEPVRMADLDHPVPMPGPTQLTFSPVRVFDETSYHSGGAGMVGTAEDFVLFAEAIRSGGGPILKPGTVEVAARNQIGDLPRTGPRDAGWRFGFLSAVLDNPVEAGTPQSVGTLQWGGVYGHQWFVDRPAGLSVAVFTNTAVYGLYDFSTAVRDAIYGRG
jgi:CubicO group peptidase (beta-lactamase class C family)